MSTLLFCDEPQATRVEMNNEQLTVWLVDGRHVSIPLKWFPRLQHGTPQERQNWRFLGGGRAIEWPELEEHIGVDCLLEGRRSTESALSLSRWLEERRGAKELVV